MDRGTSTTISQPPLLLRPFDAAHRINPPAERDAARLDRAADSGMARRGAGTHLVRAGPRALAKSAGQRSADFLVPLIGNGLPRPLAIALAEPADLFEPRVERAVGIIGGTQGQLGRRRDRGTHAWRTAALDRGNRGGLLLRRQGRERIELDPVVGDLRHVAQRVPHTRCDAIDAVNRAPRIGSRDAEFTGGGTKAAFATASARRRELRHLSNSVHPGNWPNLVQFVIGSIAGLTLTPLAPQPDPLDDVLGPLQCGQFGAMKILRDLPKSSVEFRTHFRNNRDLVHPELDAGFQAMTTRDERPTLLV